MVDGNLRTAVYIFVASQDWHRIPMEELVDRLGADTEKVRIPNS